MGLSWPNMLFMLFPDLGKRRGYVREGGTDIADLMNRIGDLLYVSLLSSSCNSLILALSCLFISYFIIKRAISAFLLLASGVGN